MGIRLIYESGVSGQTTEVTGYLPLYSFDMTEYAEEGSVALSELTLDDPNGELDIIGWRRMWAYEDTATGSNALIHYGWIGDKKVDRGPSRVGAGRQWAVAVADQNAVLSFRLLVIEQVNRPAETDVARVNWLMGIVDTFGRAPITVDEFTFDAGAVQMDAVDYRGQSVLDILEDCANQSGKNFYCYTKDNGYPGSAPTRGIWYGSPDHTSYSSPLKLTNVLSSVDQTWTFAIGESTQLERKADRVYSGAYVRGDGVTAYEQNITTYNNFTQRDAVVDAPNVKTQGGATRRALRYLRDLNTEEDRITTSYYVPAAKVNFVKPGMRIQFQATHLTGYETYRWCRVLSRQVAEIAEHEDGNPHYLVTLVLGGDPSMGDSACGSLDLTQNSGIAFGTATDSLPVTPSNCLQIWILNIRDALNDPQTMLPDGFGMVGYGRVTPGSGGGGNEGTVVMAYRFTQPGDTGSVTDFGLGADRAHILYEFGGISSLMNVATGIDIANASSITTNSVTPAGSPSLVLGLFIKSGAGPAGGNTLPNISISGPATEALGDTGTIASHDQGPTFAIGYRLVSSPSGSYTMSATGDSTGFATGPWGYVIAAFS